MLFFERFQHFYIVLVYLLDHADIGNKLRNAVGAEQHVDEADRAVLVHHLQPFVKIVFLGLHFLFFFLNLCFRLCDLVRGLADFRVQGINIALQGLDILGKLAHLLTQLVLRAFHIVQIAAQITLGRRESENTAEHAYGEDHSDCQNERFFIM